MPFVALDKETRQRIDITRHENPRQELDPDSLICPLCEQDFVIVQGFIVVHHFRHKVECTSDYQSHPESFEHLRTKLIVARRAAEWFQELSNATPELEVPIPEANRVADVLFLFPNGWRIAYEIQLASITTEQLEQRTQDYLRAGIDTIWFLGKSASTPANINWCRAQYDGAFLCDYQSGGAIDYITPEPISL